jgi:hypothetical protein
MATPYSFEEPEFEYYPSKSREKTLFTVHKYDYNKSKDKSTLSKFKGRDYVSEYIVPVISDIIAEDQNVTSEKSKKSILRQQLQKYKLAEEPAFTSSSTLEIFGEMFIQVATSITEKYKFSVNTLEKEDIEGNILTLPSIPLDKDYKISAFFTLFQSENPPSSKTSPTLWLIHYFKTHSINNEIKFKELYTSLFKEYLLYLAKSLTNKTSLTDKEFDEQVKILFTFSSFTFISKLISIDKGFSGFLNNHSISYSIYNKYNCGAVSKTQIYNDLKSQMKYFHLFEEWIENPGYKTFDEYVLDKLKRIYDEVVYRKHTIKDFENWVSLPDFVKPGDDMLAKQYEYYTSPTSDKAKKEYINQYFKTLDDITYREYKKEKVPFLQISSSKVPYSVQDLFTVNGVEIPVPSLLPREVQTRLDAGTCKRQTKYSRKMRFDYDKENPKHFSLFVLDDTKGAKISIEHTSSILDIHSDYEVKAFPSAIVSKDTNGYFVIIKDTDDIWYRYDKTSSGLPYDKPNIPFEYAVYELKRTPEYKDVAKTSGVPPPPSSVPKVKKILVKKLRKIRKI